MEKPICTMICEDCGKFSVMHKDAITIFLINKEFFAMANCLFCDRLTKDSLTKKVAISLFWKNVKIFNFNDGEQIIDQKILDKI